MKLFFAVIWDAFLDVIVNLWVDVQNLFRRFRKKKVTTFDETELYNPKMIDNGPKQNSKLRVASRSDLINRVDQKL